MLGYFKAEPNEYILAYRDGAVVQQGAGRAFWYWMPTTSIVLIPVATTDALFVLNEKTGDFQAVAVQGQITYRIVEPQTVAELLNFTIDPRTRQHRTDDPAKLTQRIINVVQAHARSELQQLSLEQALGSADRLASAVFARAAADPTLATLGVVCLSVFVSSIKATPEMTKALEAQYREALQQRADQAIYARRAEAVEQERKIKQNELSTSVALEQRRQELVQLEGANLRQRAEFEAEALRINLAPYAAIDARQVLALAFRDFADNAQKIGNFTVTSEIMEQLMNGKSG